MSLRKPVILLFVIILLIVFESAQQYFYVIYLDLAPNHDVGLIVEIFQRQILWWSIWVVSIIPLSIIIFKNKSLVNERSEIWKLVLLTVGFLVGTILVYSVIRQFSGSDDASFLEIITFKLFQKAPLSLIAYASVILVLHLAIKEQNVEILIESISTMETQIDHLKSEKIQVLTTKIGDSKKVIKLDDVISIEADDYCVNLYLTNDQKTTMRASLKSLESKLPVNFVRIHRKHIVNINFVEKFKKDGANCVTLSNDQIINISKSRLREFESMVS